MTNKIFLIFIIITVLGLTTCKKVDPCEALQPTTADFTFREEYVNGAYELKFASSDTVAFDYVIFTAKDTLADSYEWKIGASTFTGKRVGIDFSSRGSATRIPITLTVRKKPNINCFPADSGVAKLTKYVTFVGSCGTLVQGKFFGYRFENKQDTATITINTCHEGDYYGRPGYATTIYNYVPNCTIFSDFDGGGYIGYRETVYGMGSYIGSCWDDFSRNNPDKIFEYFRLEKDNQTLTIMDYKRKRILYQGQKIN